MIIMVKRIVENVLIALYQPFGFAVVMAIFSMFFYMYAREHGLKVVMQRWMNEFKTSSRFRKNFILVFYVAMILFRTLLNRDLWKNPVSDVIGVWGLYNEKGELTTEIIENLALFVPFTILMLWTFHEKLLGEVAKFFRTICRSVESVFLFSLIIEFLQLFFHLGTFQLSDLFYNTLGGLIGGLIYWIGYKVTRKHSKGDK